MARILSDVELIELTGYSMPGKQIEALRGLGLDPELLANGRPMVLDDQLTLAMLGFPVSPCAAEPPVFRSGVYVVSERNLRTHKHLRCKVGMSSSPAARLVTIRAVLGPGAMVNLEHFVPHADARDCERAAHRLLGRYRLDGEWFDCSIKAAIVAVDEAARRRPR